MPSSKRNLLAASGQGGAYEGDIAVAHSTSPYITAYPWSSGFGTKYANPATLPAGNMGLA